MASNFSDRKLIGLYAMSDHFRGIATAVGGSPKYEGFIPVLDKHGMLDSSIIPGEAGNVARQLAEEITNREAADELIMSAVDEHTNNRRNPHAVRASQLVADSGMAEEGNRVMRLQAEKVFVESTSYDTNDQPVVTAAELVTFANIEGAVASVIGEVLAGNMLLRGYVAVKTDLPQTADEGDVYIARDTGVAYLYDGTSWVVLGGVEDALTKSEANSTYLKLVGGTVTGNVYKAKESDFAREACRGRNARLGSRGRAVYGSEVRHHGGAEPGIHYGSSRHAVHKGECAARRRHVRAQPYVRRRN